MLNNLILLMFGVSWILFSMVYFKQMKHLKKYAFGIMVSGAVLMSASLLFDINTWDSTFKVNIGILLKVIGILTVLYYILKLRHQNLEITGVVIPSFVVLVILITGLIDGSHRMIGQEETFSQLFIYAHVILVMVALLFLSISCLLSLFYLILERSLKQKKNLRDIESIPSLLVLKKYILKFLYPGFLLFTGGLFLGFSFPGGPPDETNYTLRIIIPLVIWILYSGLVILALMTQHIKQVCYVVIPVFCFSLIFLFYEVFFITL